MVTNGSRYEGSVFERDECEWELTSTHSAIKRGDGELLLIRSGCSSVERSRGGPTGPTH